MVSSFFRIGSIPIGIIGEMVEIVMTIPDCPALSRNFPSPSDSNVYHRIDVDHTIKS